MTIRYRLNHPIWIFNRQTLQVSQNLHFWGIFKTPVFTDYQRVCVKRHEGKNNVVKGSEGGGFTHIHWQSTRYKPVV